MVSATDPWAVLVVALLVLGPLLALAWRCGVR
eukprot:COSAG01_NODE_26401_length_715_cov_1.084416_1_plen_31_part_10